MKLYNKKLLELTEEEMKSLPFCYSMKAVSKNNKYYLYGPTMWNAIDCLGFYWKDLFPLLSVMEVRKYIKENRVV